MFVSSDFYISVNLRASAGVAIGCTVAWIPVIGIDFAYLLGIACGAYSSGMALETGHFYCVVDMQGFIDDLKRKYE